MSHNQENHAEQLELNEPPFIEGVIDSFENGKAIIQMFDNQKIIWPKEKLPASAKEGESVKLHLTTSHFDTMKREQLAKDLLNQILKGSG